MRRARVVKAIASFGAKCARATKSERSFSSPESRPVLAMSPVAKEFAPATLIDWPNSRLP